MTSRKLSKVAATRNMLNLFVCLKKTVHQLQRVEQTCAIFFCSSSADCITQLFRNLSYLTGVIFCRLLQYNRKTFFCLGQLLIDVPHHDLTC